MSIICFTTRLDKMPENCHKCTFDGCYFFRGHLEELKKAFMTKRHPDCPLIEIPDFATKSNLHILCIDEAHNFEFVGYKKAEEIDENKE